MALHGIMSIGIVIDNTNDIEQDDIEQNVGNAYVTSTTVNIHENMIITNIAGISSGVGGGGGGGGSSGSVTVIRTLPASILGGLEDDKQQERENSLNSKTNKKSTIVKKRVCKKVNGVIDIRNGKLSCDETGEDDIECMKSNAKDKDKDKENVKEKEKLSINNFESMFSYKYNMIELKKICLQYKLSRIGNKEVIMLRIYDFFKNSIYPLKIQRVFRGYLQRKLNKLRGPALHKRNICTNDMDFYTMDDMVDIPTSQFYSYKDDDGFVYGFNILSIHNLIMKDSDKPKNPYNRNEFSNKIKDDIKRIIRMSRTMKIPIEIDIKQEILDPRKRMEMKILELFQLMNSYGNYANSEWFTNLSRNDHIRFARELVDIWNYRAQLTNAKKMEICPPHGNPFLGTPYFTNVATYINLNNLTNDTVTRFNVQIIENLIRTSIDTDNKTLGALYVLSALTLVSNDARNAMPWLYEAAVHGPD
jgi:hypothetical protein